MFLQELHLQQFRCFADKKLSFSAPLTLITGDNGVGKTSIIEAIYYLSYFKSFRSSTVSDLMHGDSSSFFLKGQFSIHNLESEHVIQIGYSEKKKFIKFDQKQLKSHKQLLSLFQVVTLTEDDIDLIKGYPASRRAFIDQAVLLSNPELLELYRKFRLILAHRNAFFEQYYQNVDFNEFEIWTKKLLEITLQIQQYRENLIGQIEQIVNQLLKQFFNEIYQISIIYDSKVVSLSDSEDLSLHKIKQLLHQERAIKRSLFGAHLDDLVFQINGQKARIYASRGQQKLICLLCKLSLILIESGNQVKPLLLIDDFLSDFDKIRIVNLIDFFISRQNQIIITAPFLDFEMKSLFQKAHSDELSINT